MGTLRAIWRRTGIGRIVDTVRNIDKEGSFWRGIKRTEQVCGCTAAEGGAHT